MKISRMPNSKQRAVRDRLMSEQALVREQRRHAQPQAQHRPADQAEDLQRPCRVVQQELDRHQVQNHADRPREAVLRLAVLARSMVHDHFADADANLAGNGWQEPVHLAVQLQRLDDLRAEDLQRAAVVVQTHAGRPGDQAVRHHRRQPPRDERVLPVLAPAADDVLALIDQIDHARQVSRIVLQIAVGGRDEPAARELESCRERRRLAEVPPEANHPDARVLRLEIRQQREALVGAAVIDQDELVRTSPRLQRVGELAIEIGEVRGFVLDRNDDGEVWGHQGNRHGMISASVAEVKTPRPARRRFQPNATKAATRTAPTSQYAITLPLAVRNAVA